MLDVSTIFIWHLYQCLLSLFIYFIFYFSSVCICVHYCYVIQKKYQKFHYSPFCHTKSKKKLLKFLKASRNYSTKSLESVFFECISLLFVASFSFIQLASFSLHLHNPEQYVPYIYSVAYINMDLFNFYMKIIMPTFFLLWALMFFFPISNIQSFPLPFWTTHFQSYQYDIRKNHSLLGLLLIFSPQATTTFWISDHSTLDMTDFQISLDVCLMSLGQNVHQKTQFLFFAGFYVT